MKYSKCSLMRYHFRHEIRAELLKRGLNMSQLSRKIGVSTQAVSATILGKRHCPQVLDALKDMGISNKYLFDPR